MGRMQTPVMMVHGMSCTGEVWSQFRQFFEDRQTRVYTPTLRPEVRTSLAGPPHPGLGALRLHDYVSDLEREASRIAEETGRRPAVIGHSMGGLLAQALAERNRVSAAVLISPAPPAGAHDVRFGAFWLIVRASNFLGLAPKAIRVDRATVYAATLNALPRGERDAAFSSMVYESGPAFNDMGHFPIDEARIRVPVMTIAATRDRLIPANIVRLVGKKYAAIGGVFREYAGHAHWLYGEPGWDSVATDIYNWLASATQGSQLSEPPVRDLAAAAQDDARLRP